MGATLDSCRCIRFGPGTGVDESTGSKVLALGPTLDSLDSLYAFDALDSEAPDGAWGGNLDLKSWGHCRCMRFIRIGPRPSSNESNESKVAPRTLVSDPTPMHVPLMVMHLMGPMHLKSGPWGRL